MKMESISASLEAEGPRIEGGGLNFDSKRLAGLELAAGKAQTQGEFH